MDQFYIYEAAVLGSDFSFFRDGALLVTASDSATTAGKIFLGAEGDIAAEWDWFLIRLLVAPEPTVTLGAEQEL